MKHPSDILIQPVITEKSVGLQGASKYVFKIHPKATKTEVKEAIENKFGVDVVKVNIIKMPTKPKRLGRFEGKRPSWKKAIITLKPGETLKGFEGA